MILFKFRKHTLVAEAIIGKNIVVAEVFECMVFFTEFRENCLLMPRSCLNFSKDIVNFDKHKDNVIDTYIYIEHVVAKNIN